MLLEFSNGCIVETNAIIFVEQFPDTISISVGKGGEFAVFTERGSEEKEKQAFIEMKTFLNILKNTGVIAKASDLVQKEQEILEKIQNFVNAGKIQERQNQVEIDFVNKLEEVRKKIKEKKEKENVQIGKESEQE